MHPILFRAFGYPIHSFGVLTMAAFLVGLVIACLRAQPRGINVNKFADGLLVALVIGLLGSRLVFILQELPTYIAHPKLLLTFELSGITSFGGVIFGLGTMLFWARRNKVPVLLVFDCVGPAYLVAHAIGRVGCLLNGCCYGGVCPSDLPFKIHVVDAPGWHYPAQAYDSVMNLIAFGLVLLLERKLKAVGQPFGMAFAAYGLTRFIYEFWRAGTQLQVDKGYASSTYWIGWMTQAQAAALVMVVVGVGLVWRQQQRPPALTPATA